MSDLTLEQALILLDESRRQNIAMLDRLYESLDIDDSDGEIRFKWVMIEIEELKQERNALAATVEALREAYSELSQNGGTLYRFKEIFATTPHQNLRQIQAEAGRAGYLEGYSDGYNDNALDEFNQVAYADNYAERVKKGE